MGLGPPCSQGTCPLRRWGDAQGTKGPWGGRAGGPLTRSHSLVLTRLPSSGCDLEQVLEAASCICEGPGSSDLGFVGQMVFVTAA